MELGDRTWRGEGNLRARSMWERCGWETRLIMGEWFCVSASVTKANGTRSSMLSSRVFFSLLFFFFFEVNRERTSFHESSRLHLARRVITRRPIRYYIDIFTYRYNLYRVRATYPTNWATYWKEILACVCARAPFSFFLKAENKNDSNSIKYCRSPLSSHTRRVQRARL